MTRDTFFSLRAAALLDTLEEQHLYEKRSFLSAMITASLQDKSFTSLTIQGKHSKESIQSVLKDLGIESAEIIAFEGASSATINFK